jgi:hypothetical protein
MAAARTGPNVGVTVGVEGSAVTVGVGRRRLDSQIDAPDPVSGELFRRCQAGPASVAQSHEVPGDSRPRAQKGAEDGHPGEGRGHYADRPRPKTPVTTTRRVLGMSQLMFWRLCCLAPRILRKSMERVILMV